jgi:LacI family transcriptional regulator
MPTIKDIAREANVSVTTVSNVIHNKSTHVAPETIDRINKIIEAYNYAPNMSARSLVNKSSRIIGVINHLIPHQASSFLQDPFHGAFIGGIERTLRLRGYYMMVRTVESEAEIMSLFRNWNLDGVILTGLFEDSFFERLVKTENPIVLLDSYIASDKIFNVGLEDYKGGLMATQYLIDRGHRSIVFASPHIHKRGVIDERYKGYRQALKMAGIPFSLRNVYEQEITISEGIMLGQELSVRHDVSAVFATADILAAGIIAGLQSKGVRVPEDMSIVGFDDLYISRITNPQLTTIHQDADGKGAIAAGLMVDSLEGKAVPSRTIIMPVSLVERGSVAAPSPNFASGPVKVRPIQGKKRTDRSSLSDFP